MKRKTDSLKYATSFRDLVVYQKARQLTREVFKISKRLPIENANQFWGNRSSAVREDSIYVAESPSDY